MSALPAVEYFDVDGLPVSVGPVPGCPYPCALWSTQTRCEAFESHVAQSRGKSLTERQFRELIHLISLGW